MRVLRVLSVVVALVVTGAVFSYEQVADTPGARMGAAAGKFLASLDAGQKQKAQLAFDSPERVNWNFVPLESRKGLPLKEMTEEQHDLARSLAQTALSEAGYQKAESIVRMENLLKALEGPNRRWPRDWQLYYFTVYGDPAGQGRWGLSIEGHHLSLNFVVENGRVVASTPQFFGINPALVKNGNEDVPTGTRVLKDEEQLAFDLLAKLDGAAKSKAVVSQEAQKEIRGANKPQPPQEPAAGLAAGEMPADAKQLLRKLIEVYAGAMPAPVAKERLAAIDQAGFDGVKFAWLGADKLGVGHSYRVQGPTFLIEFVNTQPDAEGNPANHIHSVWHDLRGDFGNPVK